MESTYRNIIVLFSTMLVLILAWSVWEINRGQAIIDEYSTVGASVERAVADAESDYKMGYYNFHYEWSNSTGKAAPGIAQSELDGEFRFLKDIEDQFFICGFRSYQSTDPDNVQTYGLHLDRYHHNDVYIVAFNQHLASLIRGISAERHVTSKGTGSPNGAPVL